MILFKASTPSNDCLYACAREYMRTFLYPVSSVYFHSFPAYSYRVATVFPRTQQKTTKDKPTQTQGNRNTENERIVPKRNKQHENTQYPFQSEIVRDLNNISQAQQQS